MSKFSIFFNFSTNFELFLIFFCSKKKKRKPAPTEEAAEGGVRNFFNSKGGVNENLKRLMVKNPGLTTNATPTKAEDNGDKAASLKGKFSVKYEKTEAEIMREKMLKEIEEREAKAKEEREKNHPEKKRLFGNGTSGGFRGDRDRRDRGDRDRDRDFKSGGGGGFGELRRGGDFKRGERDFKTGGGGLSDLRRGADFNRDRDRDRGDNQSGGLLSRGNKTSEQLKRGAGRSLALGGGESNNDRKGWNRDRERDRQLDRAADKFNSGATTLSRGTGKLVRGFGKSANNGATAANGAGAGELKPMKLGRGLAPRKIVASSKVTKFLVFESDHF